MIELRFAIWLVFTPDCLILGISGGLLGLTIIDVYGIPILLSTPVYSLISYELLNGLLLP